MLVLHLFVGAVAWISGARTTDSQPAIATSSNTYHCVNTTIPEALQQHFHLHPLSSRRLVNLARLVSPRKRTNSTSTRALLLYHIYYSTVIQGTRSTSTIFLNELVQGLNSTGRECVANAYTMLTCVAQLYAYAAKAYPALKCSCSSAVLL